MLKTVHEKTILNMIPLVMALEQEDINNVKWKSDGIDISLIHLKEGEYTELGNSLEDYTSNTEDNTQTSTLEYDKSYISNLQRSFLHYSRKTLKSQFDSFKLVFKNSLTLFNYFISILVANNK